MDDEGVSSVPRVSTVTFDVPENEPLLSVTRQFQSEVLANQHEIGNLRERLSRAQHKLLRSEAHSSKTQKSNLEAQEQARAAHDRSESLMARVRDLVARKQALEQDITELRKTRASDIHTDQLAADLVELQSLERTTFLTRNQVKSQLRAQEAEISELEQIRHKKRSDFRSRRNALFESKQSISEMQLQIDDSLNVILAVRAARSELQESDLSMAKLTKQWDGLGSSVKKLKGQRSRQSNVDSFAQASEGLKQKLEIDQTKLRTLVDSRESEINREESEARERIGSIDAKYRRLKKKKLNLEEQILGLRLAAQRLQEDLRLAEATLERHRCDRDEINRRLQIAIPHNLETVLRTAS
jgi:hypothetical protein